MYEAGVNKISLNYTPTASKNSSLLISCWFLSFLFHLNNFWFSLSLCLSEDASPACEQAVLLNDNKPEPRDNIQEGSPSPKTTLNLAVLKTAFSNNNSSSSWSKSSVGKASSSGPTQKTLQCFFKDSVKPLCSSSVKSPSKPKREMAKCQPVGRSVLDGFRYGKTSCGDADSEKDSVVLSSCDFAPTASDFQHSGLENDPVPNSPKAVGDNSTIIEDESPLSTSHNIHLAPEEPELQTEVSSSNEDSTLSPEAKRARIEKPDLLTEQKPETFSNGFDKSSSEVDAPACLQRREVQLQFSLQELTGNMKRLQRQHKERTSEELQYRRFRAKINPGENQSAEDELKKEIK